MFTITEHALYMKYILMSKPNNVHLLSLKMEDTLWASLTDSYAKLPMAMTAEKLAEQYGITKEQCDEFALTSQQRWASGNVCVGGRVSQCMHECV